MKYSIPEISWHNRDPVLSVDFQPRTSESEPFRLATGGTDSHVVIWHLEKTDKGSINLETAADLTRHQKAVNVVRWSPSGEYLASGDDESIIFVWKKADKDPVNIDGDEQYKESWVIHKTLRGHMEDVLDLSWSPCSKLLASGSVDNKLIMWDVTKARYSTILTDHKGFVQGVAWDPKGQYIVSASSDRVFRAFDIATKKVLSRSSKAILPVPKGHSLHDVKVRLYHDDTLQTFYRRLSFSPDGMLIAVPAGKIEAEQGKLDIKPINAVYIYTRYSLKVPAVIVPCGESAAVCCRWWSGRTSRRAPGPDPALPLPTRMLLAVATRRSILLYDTQQKTPVALISNIHYTRLTDLSWSTDGLTLIASSTDGFCSLITLTPGELGDPTQDKDEKLDIPEIEIPKDAVTKQDPKDTETETEKTKLEPQPIPKLEAKTKPTATTNLDSFIKIKPPKNKSPKINNKKDKTPVKVDILEEVAMASWSDNSQNDIIKPKVSKIDLDIQEVNNSDPNIDVNKNDSQDIKLFYEETEDNKSHEDVEMVEVPNDDDVEMKELEFLQKAKVTDVKASPAVPAVTAPSPKAPRRVSFVTLSSPKNSKKKL